MAFIKEIMDIWIPYQVYTVSEKDQTMRHLSNREKTDEISNGSGCCANGKLN